MKRLLTLFFTFTLVFLSGGAWAEEAGEVKKTVPGSEIEELKARIEALEKKAKDTEIVDELGHKLHPIHSIYGLKINGGLTATAQGVTHIKGAHARGAAAVSADLALESPVGENGRAVVVLDAQRGAGLKNLPPFFISPNGNPTGTNADIESFDNDTVHLTQVYYEHSFGPGLVVSVGQLYIPGYFDSNGFANDERTQFLANTFVYNPAIEWGGTDNFYSPGVRVTWWPVESIDITVGAFEGNGDYVDAFDNPFYMAELDFALKPAGKEGNYRVYYWNRQGRTDAELANTADPDNAGLVKAENKGFGVSIDQMVTEHIGVWLRAGEQRKKVAQFNAHLSFGVNINGDVFNRPDDSIGLGFGASRMSKVYRDYKKSQDASFDDANETYMEAYYSISVAGAGENTGFHISPDIQYVKNPGGDSDAGELFIYGVRLQAFF